MTTDVTEAIGDQEKEEDLELRASIFALRSLSLSLSLPFSVHIVSH